MKKVAITGRARPGRKAGPGRGWGLGVAWATWASWALPTCLVPWGRPRETRSKFWGPACKFEDPSYVFGPLPCGTWHLLGSAWKGAKTVKGVFEFTRGAPKPREGLPRTTPGGQKRGRGVRIRTPHNKENPDAKKGFGPVIYFLGLARGSRRPQSSHCSSWNGMHQPLGSGFPTTAVCIRCSRNILRARRT